MISNDMPGAPVDEGPSKRDILCDLCVCGWGCPVPPLSPLPHCKFVGELPQFDLNALKDVWLSDQDPVVEPWMIVLRGPPMTIQPHNSKLFE